MKTYKKDISKFNIEQYAKFIHDDVINILPLIKDNSIKLIYVSNSNNLTKKIREEINRIKMKFGTIYYNYNENITIMEIENIVLNNSNSLDLVLDFNCGNGNFTYLAYTNHRKVISIDKNSYNLYKSREEYHRGQK